MNNRLENHHFPKEFIEQIPSIVAMFDTEYRFLSASNLYRKEFDLIGVDLSALSLFDIIKEENTVGKDILQKCIEGKPFRVSEHQIKLNNGKSNWYKIQLQPWYKADKEIGGIISCLENITFKKLAEREVSLKSQMLNGILNNIPVIVFKVNNEGIITESLGSGLKVFEINKGSIGKNLYELFPSYTFYKEKIENRDHFTCDIEGAHEGKYWCFHTYIYPNNVDNDGVIGFSFDITSLKETEKELKIAKEKSEMANIAKSRFLSNMSHEIRTPLNAILGFSNILKREIDPSDKKAQYLEHVSSSGDILLKLIGDVLDLSKIEAGKLELHNEFFNFRKEITEGLIPYKFKANEKGLSFKLMFDEEIPEYVISDSNRINQILINLVGNALKFTKEGGIVVSFENESTKGDQSIIKISVSDTGIGISSDKQAKIFETFTQADSSIIGEFGGSGLGLSIVTEMLNLFGTQINVISPSNINPKYSNSGTTFWFNLGVKIYEEPIVASINISEKLIEKELSGKKILVAEDNEINQLVIQLILEGKGFSVDIAKNGSEVVDLLNKTNYDLVLMDIQMPGMDGYQASLMIRKSGSLIPIIGLSANVYKEDIESCYKAGMNDFVGKPINEAVLNEKIRKWVA